MILKDSKRDIFNKIVLLFAIGSIFGAYYEEIMHFIKYLWLEGNIVLVSRSGLVYGPFSPVYGIAVVLLYLFFCFKERKWYTNYFLGCFICGSCEYLASFIQEKVFGSISWDYSNLFLNINGRTTVPIIIAWGFLTLLFVYVIYPFLNKLYHKISPKVVNIFAIIVCSFLLFDVTVSALAVHRQRERHNNIAPTNFVDRFCDKHYPDELLNKIYENLVEVNYNK